MTLQSEDHGVHAVQLVDGSRFAGLLSAEQFEMTLALPATAGGAVPPANGAPPPAPADGTGAAAAAAVGAPPATTKPAAGASVTFPASSVARLQFSTKVAEETDETPTIVLANDDVLVGALTGQLKLDTAFDTITVNASEIKTLAHPTPGSLDVSVTLWDGTTLGGQVQDQTVAARLAGGLTMNVPVALLVEYQQPQPQPSEQMIEQIKQTIARLNADDWKERDRAEAQLVAMGPVASGVLRKLRANQPPEAQQRIDSILKELDKQKGKHKGSKPAAAAQPVQQQQIQQLEALPQFEHVMFDQ